jgi:arsenate reductase (thioredoxin)
MRERSIDISTQTSKTLDRFVDQPFDYVITVCDQANEACPYFPYGKNRLHWSLPDPSAAEGDEPTRLAVFRQVRDAIEARLREFLQQTAGAVS